MKIVNPHISKSNDNNIEDMIKTFKNLVDNPLSKYSLKKSLNYCKKCEKSRLESALNYYLEKDQDVCYKCKLLSKIIAYLIESGSKSFGTSKYQLKEIMNDDYWLKGLISVIEGLAIFGVKKPFVPGAPFQIVWNITRTCNMNCSHCYETASKKGKDELSKEDVINGLNILADSGVTSIAFSGGEPSLHPNILDFINFVNDNGMVASIATNGFTLKDINEAEKLVDAGLKFVQVSLDGLNPKTHDSFRKVSGSWENAVKTIENFVELGIFVEVATTVTKNNLNEIPLMIEFLKGLNIDWFMLYNFIPTGNAKNIMDIDLSPSERSNLLKKVYSENTDKMQILSTAPQYASIAESICSNDDKMIPTHFYNPEYTNPMVMQLSEFIGGCGAGRFYMSIEPNGDLYPCVFFPHNEELKIGNLIKDDFKDLWKENSLLNNLRNKKILKGNCKSCNYKNICGGCRARAYSYLNDFSAPDPGCIFNYNQWNKIKSEF